MSATIVPTAPTVPTASVLRPLSQPTEASPIPVRRSTARSAGDNRNVGVGAMNQPTVGLRGLTRARARRALAQLPDRLISLTLEQLRDNLGSEGQQIQLGEHGVFGIQLRDAVHNAADLANHPLLLEAAAEAAQQGKTLRVLENGGLLQLNGQLQRALQVSGTPVQAQAKGGVSLAYTILTPTTEISDKAVLKNYARLPLSIEDLPGKGFMFELTGRGEIAAGAKAGWGIGPTGPITGGSVGLGLDGSLLGQRSVTVRDLGERVQVTLADRDERSVGISASLVAGLDLEPILSRVPLDKAKRALTRVASFDAADLVIDRLHLRELEGEIRGQAKRLNLGDLIDQRFVTPLEQRARQAQKQLNIGDQIAQTIQLDIWEETIREHLGVLNLGDRILEAIDLGRLETLTVEEIKALPLGELVADQAGIDELFDKLEGELKERLSQINFGDMIEARLEALGLGKLETTVRETLNELNVGDRLFEQLGFDKNIASLRQGLEKANLGDALLERLDAAGLDRWETKLREALKPLDDALQPAQDAAEKGLKVISEVERIAADPTLRVGLTHNRRRENRRIQSFVIDKRSPHAAELYRSLLRLDTQRAQQLSKQPDSGVRSASLEELNRERLTKAEIGFAGEKLFAWHVAQIEGRGGFTDFEGNRYVSNERGVTRRKSGALAGGAFETQWSSVTIEKNGDPLSTMSRIQYAGLDKVTTREDLRRFFLFAERMGIDTDGAVLNDPPELSRLARIFNKRDNTQANVDVFITQPGRERFAQTDPITARRALLANKALFKPKFKGLDVLPANKLLEAERLAARFATARTAALRGTPSEKERGRRQMASLSREYTQKTGRPRIDRDLPALRDSLQLSRTLQALKQGEPWDEHFAKIGRESGFDFMPAVLTLTQLAGRENALVHQLSMTGEGVRFNSVDEGALERPSLAQIAQAELDDAR